MSKDKEDDHMVELVCTNIREIVTQQVGPKVVDLPEANKNKAMTEEFRRDLPDLMERASLVAKMRRAYFIAYVEAGFTEEQALQLCRQ